MLVLVLQVVLLVVLHVWALDVDYFLIVVLWYIGLVGFNIIFMPVILELYESYVAYAGVLLAYKSSFLRLRHLQMLRNDLAIFP